MSSVFHVGQSTFPEYHGNNLPPSLFVVCLAALFPWIISLVLTYRCCFYCVSLSCALGMYTYSCVCSFVSLFVGLSRFFSALPYRLEQAAHQAFLHVTFAKDAHVLDNKCDRLGRTRHKKKARYCAD